MRFGVVLATHSEADRSFIAGFVSCTRVRTRTIFTGIIVLYEDGICMGIAYAGVSGV
ncbi:hypothetical protein HMPREF1861_02342 [Corynebacterium kroppenstedtii]|nr:hypothetical protein HMPREF1861_02342 [Corynebacterium kroppenstedtii]